MADSNDWNMWAQATLTGIGAPVTPTNLDTLRRWTAAEKPAGMPVQWNNPLNTTQPAPGSTTVNSVGVRSFANLTSGVAATVQTLLNGNYNSIVSSLRTSKAPEEWDPEARRELGVWGTGVAWLKGAVANVAPQVKVPPPGGVAKTLPWPLNGAFDPSDLLTRIALVVLGLVLILIGLGVMFKEPLKVAVKNGAKIAEVAAVA